MYPPRNSTRAASSAAASPRTNPLRSNNDRDDPSRRAARGVDSASDMSSSQSMDDRSQEPDRDMQLLNQIVQVRAPASWWPMLMLHSNSS
jgi:hypothetical protein